MRGKSESTLPKEADYEYFINRTKQKLENGEAALGTLSMLSDPVVVETIGYAGLDFVWLDMEHTDRDMSQISNLIRAAHLTGVTPLVRVPRADKSEIQRALDSGARGVIVPNVRSAEEARAIVSATKYQTEGTRGTCRYSAAGAAGKFSQQWGSFIETANANVMTVVLVEDERGAAEIDEIVQIADVVMVGRGDLSAALGVPGETEHPLVNEVVESYEAAAKAANKPMATMCYDESQIQSAIERGYTFLMYGADSNELYRSYSRARNYFEDITRASSNEE